MGTISDLTELTTADTADLILIRDVSEASNKDKRITWTNLRTTIGDSGTWSPAITGSTTNPTVSYTTQVGRFTQIGNVVFFSLRVTINTISGGSGDLRISLPSTAASGQENDTRNGMTMAGVDVAGTPYSGHFRVVNGAAYGNISLSNDNAAGTNVQISELATTDVIAASGFYFV